MDARFLQETAAEASSGGFRMLDRSIPSSSAPGTAHDVESRAVNVPVTFDWTYGDHRADLWALYRKAKTSQWNAETELDWTTDVDLEKESIPEAMHPLFGSDLYARLTTQEHARLRVELASWTQSQFLHGEQGALLAAAQLVDAVPDLTSKLYASTQVVDEGRHVEVFERYLLDKVGFTYPISPHLRTLLDLILGDSRWDMKLLGMQVMVEGLALAAFGVTREITLEPLLKGVVTHVIQDEARHVAYGVLSLSEVYRGMTPAEVAEREDFVYEAARLMRDRFLFHEVWEKLGMPLDDCLSVTFHNESQKLFRRMLFSKIVPAIKRIGLLSPRQRARFSDLGILEFESFESPD
jgi:hypothetical protein